MKKTLIIGSLLACFLMLMMPVMPAVGYNMENNKLQKKEHLNSVFNILDVLDIPVPPWLKSLLIFIFSLLFEWKMMELYFSRTIFVDDNAPEGWYDYMHVQTIQEGIYHARFAYANNIRVYDGTYEEQITMGSCIFSPGNMGFWLIGNGSSSTILNAEGQDYGINLKFTSGWSRVIGFTIANASKSGINIGNSQWNFISENTFINNQIGIKNDGGNYSPIWKNNFIDNYQQAFDTGENDWSFDWYGDIPIAGNYWNDYTGKDTDGDGIGDTPYFIPGGNSIDSYPLMQPWEE